MSPFLLDPQISWPTSTVAPSSATTSRSVPLIVAGTSAFTLSVATSHKGSYLAIRSPGFFSQRVMVPSSHSLPVGAWLHRWPYSTSFSEWGRTPSLVGVPPSKFSQLANGCATFSGLSMYSFSNGGLPGHRRHIQSAEAPNGGIQFEESLFVMMAETSPPTPPSGCPHG